jgi:peptide/nickel transport system permease protein
VLEIPAAVAPANEGRGVAGRVLGAASRSVRALTSTPTGLIGFVLTSAIVVVGLFGPLLAPHRPEFSVSVPFDGPSGDYPFGLDYLGRDVLSRWLSGGRSVLLLASAATLIGVLGGLVIGLVAAYRRDWVDGALMRSTDLILGFPPLLLFLLVLVSFGNRLVPLVAVIGLYHAIRMSRLVRAAARDVMVLPYIEACRARGDAATHVLGREVLPNILSPVLIDAGFRLIYSVIIIASLSFLGFGIRPPAADWGLMISENRSALQLNPWATLIPAFTLAQLSVGVNLMTDARARATGAEIGRVAGALISTESRR